MVKFKYYHTGSTFNSSNLSNDDIAFVEATGSLWTHGHEYKLTDTTYESKQAANGGTAESLVTTGEKYTWNNKQKAIAEGRGITITTGATADTISFNLPIYAGSGTNSIIEGDGTTASGFCSHAEGYHTTANGDFSHAEGFYTIANGESSHAEGDDTTANGDFSHAEGYQTITSNNSEHASGQYNVSNKASTTFGDSGNTLFSVGNGTGPNAKHNAFEIRQNGDIYLTLGGQDVKLQDTFGNKVDKTTTVNGHALSGNVTVTKSDVGLGNVNNTADANKEVKAAKAIWPIAYLDNNGVGMTVAQVKTWIYTQFNTDHVSVGDYVFVSRNVIENWDDDSHVVTASSTYSFIKIAGGYNNGSINQWLIAGYGNNPIGYVGRMYDEGTSAYAWTPIKWFADLSAVEGYVPKRANNMFYPFVGASPTRGNIFKVTMPSFPDTGDFWYMVTFELVLCGSYHNAPDGRIYTTYYFRRANGTISPDVMRAVGIGSNIYNNSVSIKYDIQSPNVFYVDLGTEEYQTLAIENLSALDVATNFDFSNTTIETISSISAAVSTVPIDILDITTGDDLKFNGQPIVLNNDSRLSDARVASDVYNWAKASTKPTYTLSEVGATASVSAISSNTSSTCSITGSGNAGKIQTIIYTNSTSSDLTVTVPTTYTTPDGAAIELTCPGGGYCEVSYLNVGGTIYARGI